MNKIICLLLFFFSVASAQDTAVAATPKKIRFTEKDLKTDSDSLIEQHFRANFKSKYKTDAFVYETKLHQKNAWDRFKEWLSDLFRRLFDFQNDKTSMRIVDLVLKIIAVLLIVLVVYLIVKAIMNKDGQWIFGKNSDKKVIRYDEVEKNLLLVDFKKLIAEAVKSGESRTAIRYYYLFLLKRLTEKELISWDPEKTNSDYLSEIKNESLRQNFSYLSYLYNYIWYGEFELEPAAFEKAAATFEKTIQSL